MVSIFGLLASPGSHVSIPLVLALLPTVSVAFTLILSHLVPRLGLRKLLMLGSIGVCTSSVMAFIAAAVTASESQNLAVSIAIMIMLFLLALFLQLSWQTLPFLFAVAIVPSLGYNNESTTLFSLMVALYSVLQVALSVALGFGRSLGWIVLAPGVVLVAAFGCVVWLFFPETTGRELEDIDEYFAAAPGKVVVRDREARRVWQSDAGSEANEVEHGADHQCDSTRGDEFARATTAQAIDEDS
jgi:MFS family permease